MRHSLHTINDIISVWLDYKFHVSTHTPPACGSNDIENDKKALFCVWHCRLRFCWLRHCWVMEVLNVVYSARLRGRSIWCCLGPSRVCPLPFWPLPHTELRSCVLSRLIHCLCTFLTSGALALLELFGCNIQERQEGTTHHKNGKKGSFIRARIRNDRNDQAKRLAWSALVSSIPL